MTSFMFTRLINKLGYCKIPEKDEISIGELTISHCPHKLWGEPSYWILKSDGEGGQFQNKLLEKCIEDFYEEYF